jgi:hypothetical protein
MATKTLRPWQGALVAGLAFSMLSCATASRIETSWELRGKDVGPFKKIAVFALMENHERSKAVEMAAVEEFHKAGVTAVPGFTLIGDAKDISIDKMEAQVRAAGVDAVMIYKVIALDRDRHYIPPTTYVTPDFDATDWWDDPYWGYYAPYPYHYWGYWYPGYQVTTTPGYWVSRDTYRVETVLYRTTDNRLVWSAISDTFNPSDQSDLGRSLTRSIVLRLEREKVVA